VSTLKVNNVEDLGADPVAVNGVLVKSAFPAGTILQVLSTTKTNVFSMSSSTFADITDFSVAITPRSATSKIYVTASLYGDNSAADLAMVRLLRNSTEIAVGDADGSRIRQTTAVGTFQANRPTSASFQFLDSPATTSAVTYKAQMRAQTGTAFLNRSDIDSNNVAHPRAVSTITVMEVAG